MAETDLIRRSEVVEAIDNIDWYHQNASNEMVIGANPDLHQAWFKAEDVYKALESVPSAQPEIIRCKDCRYYQDNNNGYPHMNCKWDANETPDANDFCSGAERRTDE